MTSLPRVCRFRSGPRSIVGRCLLLCCIQTTLIAAVAHPARGEETQQQVRAARPVIPTPSLEQAIAPPPGDLTANDGEHPLMPALCWARSGLGAIQAIRDYTCTFVKRERVDGVLGEHEFMLLKVRHEPFSVYMYFLRPHEVRGQEVIYVDGLNDGKLWAHSNGLRDRVMGTVALEPRGPFAMRGNRYPLTEIGLAKLVERLIVVGESDARFGECEVRTYSGAKINDRNCLCLEVEHPRPRRNFSSHVARIYIDTQLNLPIRYEAYAWPRNPGEKPPLIEEYTYLNLRINPGLDDVDFDIRNQDYSFPREVITDRESAREAGLVGE